MSRRPVTDASDAHAVEVVPGDRAPRRPGRAGCPGSSARSSPSSRKVIWPTRKEMVTYTIVVIVFVLFMVALVACWTSSSPRACCSLRLTPAPASDRRHP